MLESDGYLPSTELQEATTAGRNRLHKRRLPRALGSCASSIRLPGSTPAGSKSLGTTSVQCKSVLHNLHYAGLRNAMCQHTL